MNWKKKRVRQKNKALLFGGFNKKEEGDILNDPDVVATMDGTKPEVSSAEQLAALQPL
jgi:hypothetical protein